MQLLLSTTIFLHFLLLLFTSAHENCGTKDPTAEDVSSIEFAEKVMFGKTVGEMSRMELSSFFKGVAARTMSRQELRKTDYQLVNVPIVYHILSKNGGSMTNKQANWVTNITNKMYNVYDKVSKESIQFVTFVQNATIVHDDKLVFPYNDCLYMNKKRFYKVILANVTEWEYKLHMVVCKSRIVTGAASFPNFYDVKHPQHNSFLIDTNAIGCYDDEGNFLCTVDSNGEKIDKTRWERTRSVVVAHEIGHLFGLFHTFQNGCSATYTDGYNVKGDGIPDTPYENGINFQNTRNTECPGLLPYDKDRDLFDPTLQRIANNYSHPNECGGDDEDVCGTSCAACCELNDDPTSKKCIYGLASETKNPICCTRNIPFDSCPNRRGIDPKNNIKTYAPDYCRHEITPGQMMRMIAQIRRYKTYIYCNYATIKDSRKCRNITCASTATSPNCV